ncbi:MAG: ATP-binding protein [Cyclobacteriaceae bacterium]|nr:ATP-binding protein [Cyclobacteriaceae bacterium]
MALNSRFVALVLSFVIASATLLFLSLVEDMPTATLMVAFMVSFIVSFLLIFIVLEILVFREVNKIHGLLGKLKNKDFSFVEYQRSGKLNPLKGINREIYSYARIKQKEIDDLRRMEVFRKEFIANVSHELKTPLFAAQGFVHTLLDGAMNDEKVRENFLEKAAKSLDGLDVLVQDLLVLSQIETGEIRMNFEYFDLHKLTLDILDQFEEKAEKKNITLVMAPVKWDVTVFADWQRIRQVLNNLISNGINYTNEGGSVKVELTQSKGRIEIKVSDTGIGIPPGEIKRIFERFFRVDKSRSRSSGGTGLGLAIVKHILEGHHTAIHVESKEGKGTTFRFSLPAEEA